jgi:predicted amidophosphoribosyltransferase
MEILKTLYSTIVEALFPLSRIEQELLAYSPEEAYAKLPPAPQVPIVDAYSVFAYKDERVAKLIWNIKYKKSAKAAEIGAYALYTKLNELNLPKGTLLLPMPITPRRRRERGFNQCELLLDGVQNLNSDGHFEIHRDILVRTQHSSRQTLKGRAERLESAKGIFEVDDTKMVGLLSSERPRIIVVIDDVITTGSTIKEAMETIKSTATIGALRVLGISLAH